MAVLLTASLAAIVLLGAIVWSAFTPRSDADAIARRPDWTGERHRRAVEEYRKQQQAGLRGRAYIGAGALLAALAAWVVVELSP